MGNYADSPLLAATQPPTDDQILEYFSDRMTAHQLATKGQSIGIDARLYGRFTELLAQVDNQRVALKRIADHSADVTGAQKMAQIAADALADNG